MSHIRATKIFLRVKAPRRNELIRVVRKLAFSPGKHKTAGTGAEASKEIIETTIEAAKNEGDNQHQHLQKIVCMLSD